MAQRLAASRAIRSLCFQPLTRSQYSIYKTVEERLVGQGLGSLEWRAGGSRLQTSGFHVCRTVLATIEVKIPALGESITDGTVAALMKQAGEAVAEDEPLVSIETDKVTVDVRAPSAGVITKLLIDEGATVEVGDVVATIDTDSAAVPAKPKEKAPEAAAPAQGLHADDEGPMHVRTPVILFPPRRTPEGERISSLPAKEADRALRDLGWLKGPAVDEFPPTVLAAAAPPPRQGPWLQQHRDVEVHVDDSQSIPRTTMSEREMELIMLGGAEP